MRNMTERCLSITRRFQANIKLAQHATLGEHARLFKDPAIQIDKVGTAARSSRHQEPVLARHRHVADPKKCKKFSVRWSLRACLGSRWQFAPSFLHFPQKLPLTLFLKDLLRTR